MDPEKARQSNKPNTVYQYLKIRNFSHGSYGHKKITIKVIDRFDDEQRILLPPGRGNVNPDMIGPFAYDEMSFEPISLADLGIQSDDFINFSIYGRVDTRIFRNSVSPHMLID